jgi:hypothetical protein
LRPKQTPHEKVSLTPSPFTDAQAFKDEAQKIRDLGGVPNKNLYNKINSPGEKMLAQPNKK